MWPDSPTPLESKCLKVRDVFGDLSQFLGHPVNISERLNEGMNETGGRERDGFRKTEKDTEERTIGTTVLEVE